MRKFMDILTEDHKFQRVVCTSRGENLEIRLTSSEGEGEILLTPSAVFSLLGFIQAYLGELVWSLKDVRENIGLLRRFDWDHFPSQESETAEKDQD